MALSVWLSLKRAEAAVRAGLWTEAGRLLDDPRVRTHRRAVELRGRLADRLCDRTRRALDRGDPAGAVCTGTQVASPGPELLSLLQAARQWCQAHRWAAAGRFDLAGGCLDLADAVGVGGAALEAERTRLQDRASQYAEARDRMHRALEAGEWRGVADACDRVLSLAPGSAEAKHLQRLAQERWIMSQSGPIAQPPGDGHAPFGRLRPARTEDAVRGILWIDGVGGYLVLTGGQVRLGQTGGADEPDIPVRADLSRCHATITRHDEDYRLAAHRACTRNGRPVDDTLLVEGDRLVLGSGTTVRFDLPVQGSGTAVIRFDDPQRLPWPIDGVILLADTLVVGTGGSAHVAVPDAESSVALFRRNGRWWARAVGQDTDAQADELSPDRALTLGGMRLRLEVV